MLDKEKTMWNEAILVRYALLQEQLKRCKEDPDKDIKKSIRILEDKIASCKVDWTENVSADEPFPEHIEAEHLTDSGFPAFFYCNSCSCLMMDGTHRYHHCDKQDFDLCEACYLKDDEEAKDKLYFMETEDVVTRVEKIKAQKSLSTALWECFKAFSTRPCLGTVSSIRNGYDWWSYQRVGNFALKVAQGLKSSGLNPGDRVMICSEVCNECFAIAFGCTLGGFAVVPTHFKATKEGLSYIKQHANVSFSFYSTRAIRECNLNLDEELGKYLIFPSVEDAAPVEEKRSLYTQWIEQSDQEKEEDQAAAVDQTKSEDELFLLVYTSGSTGNPKAAMFSRGLFYKMVMPKPENVRGQPDPYVDLVAGSMSYISNIESTFKTILWGARVGLVEPADSDLLQKIEILQPTVVSETPRFWELVFSVYQLEMSRRMDECEKLYTRPSLLQIGAVHDQVVASTKAILGNRVKVVGVGGGPVSEAVMNFLTSCWGKLVYNGYGCTEVGSIASNGVVNLDIDFKLIDIPEMGYTQEDKPHPRGELAVKSKLKISGYLNNEGANSRQFTEDGYFRTGDVVELMEGRKIRIVDRHSNIFKLAQGEFVSPEHLEGIWVSLPIIKHAMATHADLQLYPQSGVVAIVVPDVSALIFSMKKTNDDDDDDGMTKQWLLGEEVNEFILHRIVEASKQAGLRGWEIPMAVILETEEWTAANQGLTISLKLNRPALTRKYRDAANAVASLRASNPPPSPASSLTRTSSIEFKSSVRSVISQVLRVSPAAVMPWTFLASIGLDSLMSVALAYSLKKSHNLDVSATDLLNPTYTVGDIMLLAHEEVPSKIRSQPAAQEPEQPMLPPADQIQSIKPEQPMLPPADQMQSIKPEQPMLPPPDQVQSITTIVSPPEMLQDALQLAESFQSLHSDTDDAPLPSNLTVFLTGATGFVGSFLLRSLLQHPSRCPDKIYCLVRASANETAEQRLRACLDTVCEGMEHSELLSRVVPVSGDLGSEHFGMTPSELKRIASSCSVFVHCGAEVNHVKSYSALRSPNVLGTRTFLSMIPPNRNCRVLYISTTGAVCKDEYETVLESAKSIYPTSETAYPKDGYSQTKWAGEVLFWKIVEQFKWTDNAVVARLGMISWDTTTGYRNDVDWLNRLVKCCLEAGASPRTNSGWDLVPVDRTGYLLAAIALAAPAETALYVPKVFHFAGIQNQVSVRVFFEYAAKVANSDKDHLLQPLVLDDDVKTKLESVSKFVNHSVWLEYCLKEFHRRQEQGDIVGANRLAAATMFPNGIPSSLGSSIHAVNVKVAMEYLKCDWHRYLDYSVYWNQLAKEMKL